MSRGSPFVIVLSAAERFKLERRTRCYSLAYALVVRARIVLLAAEGFTNVDIAEALGVHVGVVSRWRKRFCEEGIAGLNDRPRSGRPRLFGPEVVGVSLGAPARLRLRRAEGSGYVTHAQELAPRSAYVLGGESRSLWQHTLSPLKGLRYSLTFRTLRPGRKFVRGPKLG